MIAKYVNRELRVADADGLHHVHVLYDMRSRRFVRLGRALNLPPGRLFEGPVVTVDGSRYLLPRQYLNLLIERFLTEQGEQNVVLDLWDNLIDVPDDAPDDYWVGGDTAEDIPLLSYLPEIDLPSVKKEIRRYNLRPATFDSDSVDL